MTRYLGIYYGAVDEASKTELTDQQEAAFMHDWATWAQTYVEHLVDPGAPLSAKKRVTAQGVEDFTDATTGYCVLSAESHDEAARIFSEHPHLRLFPGNAIAVLECPPIPG